jgi:opacity protein-like surface antigen
MKKVSFLVLALLCIGTTGMFAQFKVGGTIGVQIPIGSMADGMKTGFGFNVAGKYMLSDNFDLGLNIGWARFGVEDVGVEDVTASGQFIPVTALAEYHFNSSGKVKPYIGADMGLYVFKVKAKSGGYTASTSDSYFGLAPVVGIEYEMKENLALAANLKYNYVIIEGDDGQYLGINVGVIYKFK